MTKIEYRKINRTGFRRDNKKGLGWCFNVVIPQAMAFKLGLDKESVIRFTLTGKNKNVLKLEKA